MVLQIGFTLEQVFKTLLLTEAKKGLFIDSSMFKIVNDDQCITKKVLLIFILAILVS